MIKAGAQRVAAELGLALVTCDTSPRAARFAGDDEAGTSASAPASTSTPPQAPWSAAYRMHSYVVEELPALVEREFPVAGEARGIFGHSMGGHGALVLALRHPERYRSVSAFAPIVRAEPRALGRKGVQRATSAPIAPPGPSTTPCELLARRRFAGTLLVDQGTEDNSSSEQLQPELLRAACAAGRPAARAAPARGLRPQLLVHRHLRRRAPAPPRARARPLG